MSTLVCFHAHPDDEAITTGGLMSKASAAGHRVILVTATRGERGEVQPGILAPGEELSHRRVAETQRSAELLGAESPIFLDYEDSGMVGDDSNENPNCFWQANVAAAAAKLAHILSDADADVMTIYDDHGLYGHPDHIQVHRVGLEAARLAGLEHVFEATTNRSKALEGMLKMRSEAAAAGADLSEMPNPEEFGDFGVLAQDLAFRVDVAEQVGLKRAALRVHETQVSEQSFFLNVSDEQFSEMFGQEWFAIPGRTGTGGPELVELLPGL